MPSTLKSFEDDESDVESESDENNDFLNLSTYGNNSHGYDFDFDFHSKGNDDDFDESTDDFDPLKVSFRSTYSNNSCTMPSAKKNLFDSTSPPKARKKMAMVVKQPKAASPRNLQPSSALSPSQAQTQKLEASISTLEGELTNFLSMNDVRTAITRKNRQDDGTTSTTSRTTKSSVNSRNGTGHGASDGHNHKSDRSMGDLHNSSHINNNRSNRPRLGSSNHNAWDWSHHSNDWMNLESAAGSDHFATESDKGNSGFFEMEGDELTRQLNDSIDIAAAEADTMNNSSRMNRSSRSAANPIKPQSRRIARQQEVFNSSAPSPGTRRQGDRSTLRTATHHAHAHARARRSRSRDSCSCSVDSDDTPQASVMARRRSGTKSAHVRTIRSKSRDRARQSRSKSRDRACVRSKSRDRTREMRSSSPTNSSRRRRASGSHKGPSGSSSLHHRRSRSIDGQSHHSAASESATTPYSTNQSRRGRRRTSLNLNASMNLNLNTNLNASATWVDAIPAKEVAERERSERGERRGRQGRRSSMTNATLIVEEQRHQKQRGKSASGRTSRRRSTGDDSYNEDSSMNGSRHGPRDSLMSSRHGPRDNSLSSSRHRDALGGSRHTKQHHHTSSHRRGSASRRGSGRSKKNMDKSGEIVPERLNAVLNKSNHNANHESSHFEKVAMAIFVAEDGDHDEFNDSAFEKVPPHLLADPSNVPLSMHW